MEQPAPFVLQTSLDDFYVSYQVNAYTDRASAMAVIQSGLHEQIQEKFNAAGVEIMSQHYLGLRDGNAVTIPESQRPKGYEAPSFRVKRPPTYSPSRWIERVSLPVESIADIGCFGVQEEGSNEVAVRADGLHRFVNCLVEIFVGLDRLAAEETFEVSPDVLIRVHVRGVARKVVNAKPRSRQDESAGGGGDVGRVLVENQIDGAANVVKKGFEELDEPRAVSVPLKQRNQRRPRGLMAEMTLTLRRWPLTRTTGR